MPSALLETEDTKYTKYIVPAFRTININGWYICNLREKLLEILP